MKQGCNFGKEQSKFNYSLLKDNLKLYDGNQPDIDILMQTVYTVTDDVGMRFGIDTCGVLAMRRGKESECEGEIDDDGYKYLGIMERSDIC